MSDERVDWETVARDIGALSELEGGSRFESGGSSVARAALARIMDPEVILSAVAHGVSHRPGSEVAVSVLRHLRSPVAMQECYRIYRESEDPCRRADAVELLTRISDASALPWVAELLDDPCPRVRMFTTWMLKSLVYDGVMDEHLPSVRALVARIAAMPAEEREVPGRDQVLADIRAELDHYEEEEGELAEGACLAGEANARCSADE